MKKIGILYICTGKYSVFWKEFYETFEERFLTTCERHYYVFTDAEKLDYEDTNPNIHRYYQEAMPWPYPALYRYRTFLWIEQDLQEMDFLFFFNANLKALQTITEEMILPRPEEGEELAVTIHPQFVGGKPYQFTYDRNPCCSAFIPYCCGKVYVAGGLNGGKTEAFLKMYRELARKTDKDLKKGVIARWHDESYLNHYVWLHRKYRLLSPAYLYPEEIPIPYEPILYLRDKSRSFDVAGFKGAKSVDMTPEWARKINAIMRDMEERWYKAVSYYGEIQRKVSRMLHGE